MDNPLFQSWVGGIVRHLLTSPVSYFVTKGIISADDGTATIVAATTFTAGLIWSLYLKYKQYKAAEAAKGVIQ